MITTINNAIAKKREDGEKGFTLIELLVVILIIGVLAAIAIPAFLNQRQGAWQSQVESDLKNAAIAAESYAVGHNGKYTSSTDTTYPSIAATDALKEEGFNKTADVTVTPYVNGDGTKFKLVGTHGSITTGDQYFVYDSATGVITATSTAVTGY